MSRARLRAAFDICDKLHRGYIIPRNFAKFIKVTTEDRIDPPVFLCEAVMMYYSNVRQLNYNYFSIWWNTQDRYRLFEEPYSGRLNKAYGLYSNYISDRTSTLDYDHLHELVAEFGLDLSYSTFTVLDRDHDGAVSFREFCDWLRWFD